MNVPDWLLVVLGASGLALSFALLGQWLGVMLLAGLVAGFALGIWL